MINKLCDYCKKEIQPEKDNPWSEWTIYHFKKRRDFCSKECFKKWIMEYFENDFWTPEIMKERITLLDMNRFIEIQLDLEKQVQFSQGDNMFHVPVGYRFRTDLFLESITKKQENKKNED